MYKITINIPEEFLESISNPESITKFTDNPSRGIAVVLGSSLLKRELDNNNGSLDIVSGTFTSEDKSDFDTATSVVAFIAGIVAKDCTKANKILHDSKSEK